MTYQDAALYMLCEKNFLAIYLDLDSEGQKAFESVLPDRVLETLRVIINCPLADIHHELLAFTPCGECNYYHV